MDVTAVALKFFEFVEDLTAYAFVLGILAIIFIGRRGRRHRYDAPPAINGADQAISDDLGRLAEKMERRLDTLEKILETDDPKWRERAP